MTPSVANGSGAIGQHEISDELYGYIKARLADRGQLAMTESEADAKLMVKVNYQQHRVDCGQVVVNPEIHVRIHVSSVGQGSIPLADVAVANQTSSFACLKKYAWGDEAAIAHQQLKRVADQVGGQLQQLGR